MVLYAYIPSFSETLLAEFSVVSIPPSAQLDNFVEVFNNLEFGEYSVVISAENDFGIGTPSEAIIVSLFASQCGLMDGWMDEWMDGWMDDRQIDT